MAGSPRRRDGSDRVRELELVGGHGLFFFVTCCRSGSEIERGALLAGATNGDLGATKNGRVPVLRTTSDGFTKQRSEFAGKRRTSSLLHHHHAGFSDSSLARRFCLHLLLAVQAKVSLFPLAVVDDRAERTKVKVAAGATPAAILAGRPVAEEAGDLCRCPCRGWCRCCCKAGLSVHATGVG